MTLAPDKPKRRALRVILFLTVVGALVAGGLYLARPDPVAVLVVAVERGSVEATVANTRAGSVRACRRAKLTPSTGGQIAGLPIAEGDRVKRGDVLLTLWNDDLAAQVELAESQAAVSRARARERCLDRDQAIRDQERIERLYADGLESIENVEQVRSRAAIARAACEAAEATTTEAEASIRVAKSALARTVLTSPFDGVVAELNGELGEYVTPSPPGIPTPPAVDLIEAGCLYIVAPIDEVDAGKVRLGQDARVRLDSFRDRTFSGRVRRIAPYVLEVEKQARTVDVEVEITNRADLEVMIPGFSADVEILLDTREGVLRVPTESIVEGRRVLVLVDGQLVEREVERGLSNWAHTEIVSGLSERELVVVSLGRDGVEAGAEAVVEDPGAMP